MKLTLTIDDNGKSDISVEPQPKTPGDGFTLLGMCNIAGTLLQQYMNRSIAMSDDRKIIDIRR